MYNFFSTSFQKQQQKRVRTVGIAFTFFFFFSNIACGVIGKQKKLVDELREQKHWNCSTIIASDYVYVLYNILFFLQLFVFFFLFCFVFVVLRFQFYFGCSLFVKVRLTIYSNESLIWVVLFYSGDGNANCFFIFFFLWRSLIFVFQKILVCLSYLFVSWQYNSPYYFVYVAEYNEWSINSTKIYTD